MDKDTDGGREHQALLSFPGGVFAQSGCRAVWREREGGAAKGANWEKCVCTENIER